mgnify:CR=1 FL=1
MEFVEGPENLGDVQNIENVENVDTVVKPEKPKPRGTPLAFKRNFLYNRWEIIYVKDGKIYHQKYRSSTEICEDPIIPIKTRQHLNYYLRVREQRKTLQSI